jgi:ABC-type nitrate/sulfonate/bicarbonate transport system substrate-binding protein
MRFGFMPQCEGTPMLMAREPGLFEKYGLPATLSCEVCW